MVQNTVHFTEYTFEGQRFQWATFQFGKGKGSFSIQLDYETREGNDKWFTLRMDGKTIITQQDYSDFYEVTANIEDKGVRIYSKEQGFNVETLQNYGKLLRWGR